VSLDIASSTMKLVVVMMIGCFATLWAGASGSACIKPEEISISNVECRLHGVKSTWSAEDRTRIARECAKFGEGTRWGDLGEDSSQTGECKLGDKLKNDRGTFDPWCTELGGWVALWGYTKTQRVEMVDASQLCSSSRSEEGMTCGGIKELYKSNDCCGNPSKTFIMDSHRRLHAESDTADLLKQVVKALKDAKAAGGTHAAQGLARQLRAAMAKAPEDAKAAGGTQVAQGLTRQLRAAMDKVPKVGLLKHGLPKQRQ